MKLKVMILLSTLFCATSFATQRVGQYCVGEASFNGQTNSVTYYDGCGMEAKPCFISISVGEEKKSLSVHTGAQVKLYPASESEVVVAETAKEEVLVILHRTGSRGTLTYLNDQNQVLSNLPVRCSDNDDK